MEQLVSAACEDKNKLDEQVREMGILFMAHRKSAAAVIDDWTAQGRANRVAPPTTSLRASGNVVMEDRVGRLSWFSLGRKICLGEPSQANSSTSDESGNFALPTARGSVLTSTCTVSAHRALNTSARSASRRTLL